jgi:hypothetical protein
MVLTAPVRRHSMSTPLRMRMASLEEQLEHLEKELRRLVVEYRQFFGEVRALPPLETQWRTEQLLKRCAEDNYAMTSAQRFRYTNLATSYATYQELWRKRTKQKEQGGERRRFVARSKR